MINNNVRMKYFFIFITLVIMGTIIYFVITGKLFTQSETKEIIYKNTVTNGDDYLNCQVINNNKLIIDFYDHAAQTSYLKLISSQGMELSKRKVNGITTYGIATTENLVALAVNNYIEFMELG